MPPRLPLSSRGEGAGGEEPRPRLLTAPADEMYTAGVVTERLQPRSTTPFLGSSMVEQAAVNRKVRGSNPLRGAKTNHRTQAANTFRAWVFVCDARLSSTPFSPPIHDRQTRTGDKWVHRRITTSLPHIHPSVAMLARAVLYNTTDPVLSRSGVPLRQRRRLVTSSPALSAFFFRPRPFSHLPPHVSQSLRL